MKFAGWFLGWILLTVSLRAEVPDIVFILADDVAWSDFRCYGHPYHDTPNIDRLAGEGIRFTQAYAPAPICSASRAAILTGKTPARLNFEFVTKDKPGAQAFTDVKVPLQSPPFTMNLSLEDETMGEALGGAGFETGFFGKWHVNQHYKGYLGWSPTHGPLQQGFDEGDSDFGSHPYAYRKQKGLRDQPVPDGVFPEDTLTDKAIEFLSQERENPFFLYLSHYYIHDPVHSRCQWLIEKYRDRLPEGAFEIRASYGAMVETLDHQVGRVLEALDASGLASETLVVLMADNGGHPNYTTNAPLRGSKWNLYEGGIRIPMMARWPGRIPQGVVSDAAVHGCDWMPTFCEVAGVDAPDASIDGVSLVPLLIDPKAAIERSHPLIWHFPYYHPERRFETCPEEIGIGDYVTSQTRPHSVIRDGDWKLIHFYEDDQVELYNLEADLGEQNDLAAQKPEIAQALKGQLKHELEESDARLPSRKF
ncbi:MAG: sulfatase [Verrucomicrobiota bacterium]